MKGEGFRVKGSGEGFRVMGSGLRVKGVECWVYDPGIKVKGV